MRNTCLIQTVEKEAHTSVCRDADLQGRTIEARIYCQITEGLTYLEFEE